MSRHVAVCSAQSIALGYSTTARTALCCHQLDDLTFVQCNHVLFKARRIEHRQSDKFTHGSHTASFHCLSLCFQTITTPREQPSTMLNHQLEPIKTFSEALLSWSAETNALTNHAGMKGSTAFPEHLIQSDMCSSAVLLCSTITQA